jgi:Spy/CpxP family protein refolding chaperone
MQFQKQILTWTAVTALAAGSLFAMPARTGRTGRFDVMATRLGLTDAQKTQAQSIFANQHQLAKPVFQQLRQERQAVRAAAQAGKSDQEIQQLAAAEGPQLAQLAALRASAHAKFMAILTPAQQQQLASMRQARHAHHRGAQTPPPSAQ